MSTDWQRPLWQPSEGRSEPSAELSYFIPGGARPDAAAPGGPAFNLQPLSRHHYPTWFPVYFDSPGWGDDLGRALGERADEVRAAQEGIRLTGAFVDPPALDYLRDTLGVISALLESGNLAVLDLRTGRWWSAGEWLDHFRDRSAFAVEDHIEIVASPGRQPSPALWTRTRGLDKFARPNLRIRHLPGWWQADDPLGLAAGDLLRDLAGQLCRGARIPTFGEPLTIPGCARACACVATPGYRDSEPYLESGLCLKVVDWDPGTGAPLSDLRLLLGERLGGEPAQTPEGAFLQALAEDPADDAARLIYADWLEEGGHAARAEWLRLEVRLAQAAPGDEQRATLEARLRKLAANIDRGWSALAGKRYELLLLGYPPTLKITTIQRVRELTGLGLKEAKDLVERPLPTTIYSGVARVLAERDAERCRKGEMTVVLRACR
jgi:uncharacterized protein (TIGR02996 family)